MSQGNMATSNEPEFALRPPQTVDATGHVEDDVRAVDPSYGGLLGKSIKDVVTEKTREEIEATSVPDVPRPPRHINRGPALNYSLQLRVEGRSLAMILADAKLIEAYLRGE